MTNLSCRLGLHETVKTGVKGEHLEHHAYGNVVYVTEELRCLDCDKRIVLTDWSSGVVRNRAGKQ